MSKYDEFLKNAKNLIKELNTGAKDIHLVRLPSKKEWKKLEAKLRKKLMGWSDIIIEKDDYGMEFIRVRFLTDKVSQETIDRISSLLGITAVLPIENGIDVIADFCPLCSEEHQDIGIKNINSVPILLRYGKSINQLQG